MFRIAVYTPYTVYFTLRRNTGHKVPILMHQTVLEWVSCQAQRGLGLHRLPSTRQNKGEAQNYLNMFCQNEASP